MKYQLFIGKHLGGLMVLALAISLAAGIANADITANLMAHYKFEGNTKDFTGKHDGTLVGTANWVDGQESFGKAIEFTGPGNNSSYVTCGNWDPTGAGVAGELSVALWTRWNGTTDNWQCFIAKRSNWGPDMMWQFVPRWQSDHELWFENPSIQAAFGVHMTQWEGKWTHLAVVADGENATLYVNGEETGTMPFFCAQDTQTPIQIGASGPDQDLYNGAIDEVYIYSRALNADEVLELKTEGVGTAVIVSDNKLATTWGKVKR